MLDRGRYGAPSMSTKMRGHRRHGYPSVPRSHRRRLRLLEGRGGRSPPSALCRGAPTAGVKASCSVSRRKGPTTLALCSTTSSSRCSLRWGARPRTAGRGECLETWFMACLVAAVYSSYESSRGCLYEVLGEGRVRTRSTTICRVRVGVWVD